jgi:hypothetical protein
LVIEIFVVVVFVNCYKEPKDLSLEECKKAVAGKLKPKTKPKKKKKVIKK